jgi:hypothetical protein
MSRIAAQPRKHGTITMYVKGGCRCQPCKDAKSAYVLRQKGERSWIKNATHGRESTYGYGCRCQPCKDAAASARRRRKYGTESTVEELLEAQGGGCASCGSDSPGSRHGWHIDHNHATGKVREVLCAGCNTALGMLGENPVRIRALADYIERHTRKIGF